MRLRSENPSLRVEELCELFGVTKQAYYQGFKASYKSVAEDDVVLEMVRDMRKKCPGIGTRKLHVMLKANYQIEYGRDRLFSLLDREGLLMRQRHRKPRTTYSGHLLPVYTNLVKGIVPTRPNHVWVSDITYVKVDGAFMYLFLITDMYSRKIVGWSLASDMGAPHAVSALKMALRQRKVKTAPLIHHSDRGSQYCCSQYVKVLKNNYISISMTENGDPRENAYAERVNGTIKNEYIKRMAIGVENAQMVVATAIRNYNDHRPHASIEWLTPSEAHMRDGMLYRKWKHYPWYSRNNPEKFANFAEPQPG